MTNNPAVSFEDVLKDYPVRGDTEGVVLRALDGVSLTIQSGEVVGVVV